MFCLQVISVVFCVYGFLSLVQDIINEITYKKVFHNMKIIVFAKKMEENIEQFLIEFKNMKKVNPYKQIIVIDLDETDKIENIKNKFYDSEVNIDVLSKNEGIEYIDSKILL